MPFKTIYKSYIWQFCHQQLQHCHPAPEEASYRLETKARAWQLPVVPSSSANHSAHQQPVCFISQHIIWYHSQHVHPSWKLGDVTRLAQEMGGRDGKYWGGELTGSSMGRRGFIAPVQDTEHKNAKEQAQSELLLTEQLVLWETSKRN